MRLEDEIKQSVFPHEGLKAFLNVVYTAGWLAGRVAASLRAYGLTMPQFNILRILRGQHPQPATVALLTERMLDKSSNASRIVDKLVLKQLATRCACPSNRRAVDIRITEAGLALLREIEASGQQDPHQLGLHHLSESELQQLNALLDKIRTRP